MRLLPKVAVIKPDDKYLSGIKKAVVMTAFFVSEFTYSNKLISSFD